MITILSHSHTDDHHHYFDALVNGKPVRSRLIRSNQQVELHYNDLAKAYGYPTAGAFLLECPGAIEIVADFRHSLVEQLKTLNHATAGADL